MPKYNVEFTITQYGTVEGVEADSRQEAEASVLDMDFRLLVLFVDDDGISAYAERVEETYDGS